METISLNGDWQLKIIGGDSSLTGEGITATVPGSVYSALLDHKLIEDPYYRDNELKVLPIMDNDFEYTTSFEITDEMLREDGLILKFNGIDTLADIYVNGVWLGHTSNMHRSYEFDLLGDGEAETPVHPGINELKVLIASPTRYIKAANEESYTGGSSECMEGFPHIRKAHCMFGWDWGPRIPDAGIFRNVELLVIHQARIDDVKVTQNHIFDTDNIVCINGNKPKQVVLNFDVDIEQFGDDNDIAVTILVAGPNGEIYTPIDNPYEVLIDDPKLWWPNGFGKQPLYTVSVAISDYRHRKLDERTIRIGLRRLTMNTEPDEYGECFAHEVNGVKIFAMGADYIPEDNLLSRVTPDRTYKLLSDAVWANHNCIRVWGGGYYLDDWFYDFCDELGLIVWQDFMYACAAYDLTEEFEQNIIEETHQVVRRLRHHASIGIWCGNNELETQVLDGAWHHSLKQKADYTKMYEYIIPKILKEEYPEAFYWPSSPSSGGAWDNPWDEHRGDAHYWDVWHGEKPFTDYRKYRFRYLSEFGFQAFPDYKTIKSFTEEEDRNIFSYVMEMHQRNRAANGKLLSYLSATYLYPRNFEMLTYATQLLQGDAIRYGVEHFRRNRGECMGAVVWQLNDIWPVASWSSIDYYGRWKALHYLERRMFAPIMISCEEEGELTQRRFVIDEPHPIDVGARLHVANETMNRVEGLVKWSLRNPDSTIVEEGSFEAGVEPLDGQWFPYIDFGKYDVHKVHLDYEFVKDGETVSSNTVLFTPPKHYEFIDPELTLEVNSDSITVTSKAYAKNVFIEGTDGELFLEDNCFDMEAGSITVKIISQNATKVSVKSVFDIA